jgi:hypothetical protein
MTTNTDERAKRINADGLEQWQAGRQTEAVATFEAASEAARQDGYDAADVASIDGNLAFAAHAIGAYDKAYAAQKRILGFREAAFAEQPKRGKGVCLILAP